MSAEVKHWQETLVANTLAWMANTGADVMEIRAIYNQVGEDMTYAELQRTLSRLEATQRVRRVLKRSGKPDLPRRYHGDFHRLRLVAFEERGRE